MQIVRLSVPPNVVYSLRTELTIYRLRSDYVKEPYVVNVQYCKNRQYHYLCCIGRGAVIRKGIPLYYKVLEAGYPYLSLSEFSNGLTDYFLDFWYNEVNLKDYELQT